MLGVTQAIAASHSATSAGRLRAAELMVRGPDRDAALALAQISIADALAVAPKDAGVHARKARALYLQAATATLPDISIPLLDAASAAVDAAHAAGPDEAGALATRALIVLARNGGAPDDMMARTVAESFAARARDPETALWRVQAAGAAWPALDAATKLAAADEACVLLRVPSVQERAQVAAARMGSELGPCQAAPTAPASAP